MKSKAALFRAGFDDVMTRHGFVFKNKVFIRMIGDEIVQSFCLKPLEYYDICAAVFPLWAAEEVLHLGILPIDMKKHSYWCENLNVVIPEWKPLRSQNYYKIQSKEQIIDAFKYASECIEKDLIPILDNIVNFNTFMEWLAQTNVESDKCSLQYFYMIGDNSLVYKSNLDGNFDFALEYIESAKKRVIQNSVNAFPYDQEIVDLQVESALKRFNIINKTRYAKLYRSIQLNDTSWIVDYIKERREIEVTRFADAFPSVFGHLVKS